MVSGQDGECLPRNPDQKEDQSNSAAKKAMLYIQENYNKDISLDDVSGIVNISLITSARSLKKRPEKTLLNM